MTPWPTYVEKEKRSFDKGGVSSQQKSGTPKDKVPGFRSMGASTTERPWVPKRFNGGEECLKRRGGK